MVEKQNSVNFKEIIQQMGNGENEAFSLLYVYHDKPVKFVQRDYYTNEVQGNSYLQRDFEFTVAAVNRKYHYCLKYFKTKLDRQDINELFINGLYEFVSIQIDNNELEDKTNGQLLKWFNIFIEKYILKHIENIYGKVKKNKETGELTKEITLMSDALSYKQYEYDGIEPYGCYSKKSFEEWVKEEYSIGFGKFIEQVIDDKEIKELLTPLQYKVYCKLVDKYSIDNQKQYGYSHIARELGISESRVRQIENEDIATKIHKLYDLWKATKCPKDTPLSHEIRDFFKMYNNMIEYSDDLDLKFNMIISWLKMMISKIKEQNSFEWFQKNKPEKGLNIIDLISDNSEFSEIIHNLNNKLHSKTYIKLIKILNDEEIEIRKETKETIVKKVEGILFTYLQTLDKDVKRVKKYVATYSKNQKSIDYSNKKDLAPQHFNKKNTI
ncbi:hypothetical protein GMB86_11855 [Terrilactibacillus sp. BCM23-1]|uniref:Death domain-containing protein n=1 Tax=Terrilactibacillus tamarindi TaxID=2599694 RepID=A0A6N8CRM3_9BACI|nr:hypothetical protein [Terrilactibacillus tamarindi]MTT32701.1 hypothetical protein [Terrilactibacillus tamarindi]